jgi:hypothetical protein
VEETIRPATDADLAGIAVQEAVVLGLLHAHYGTPELGRDESDLHLMQRLLDDRAVRPEQTRELECLGTVLGQVFASTTPLRWITVEYAGKRQLALQYPGTTVIVFPGSMILKRVQDGRGIDVDELYHSVVEQVGRMKDDPEYQRDPNWSSPVGDPDQLDLVAARHDGGVDLILVASRPLDNGPQTRGVVCRKLRNYCLYVASQDFADEFGLPSPERTRIVVRMPAEPPAEIVSLLAGLHAESGAPAGLEVEVEEGTPAERRKDNPSSTPDPRA